MGPGFGNSGADTVVTDADEVIIGGAPCEPDVYVELAAGLARGNVGGLVELADVMEKLIF